MLLSPRKEARPVGADRDAGTKPPHDRSKPRRAGAISPLVRKLSVFTPLSKGETAFLQALQAERQELAPRSDILIEGQRHASSYVLRDGWAFRYKVLADGRRQIINFILPGDFIALHAVIFERSDHSVSTLTSVVLCPFPPETILELHRGFPKLAAAVTWCTAREQAMLGERIVDLGRRSAYERTAHFFLELRKRLQLIGLAGGRAFELPLTQEILADTLGLSVPHVNRTLRSLRQNGLVRWRSHRLVIDDVEGLAKACDFGGDYLHQRRPPKRAQGRLARLAK